MDVVVGAGAELDVDAVGDVADEAAGDDGFDLGTDPAAVSLATTRVSARFSDLRRSFSTRILGIC